jgi:hypothetical protein
VLIETLIRMGHDITRNNAALPPDRAADRIARHLTAFWTREMIAELQAFASTDSGRLDPSLVAALRQLAASS